MSRLAQNREFTVLWAAVVTRMLGPESRTHEMDILGRLPSNGIGMAPVETRPYPAPTSVPVDAGIIGSPPRNGASK